MRMTLGLTAEITTFPTSRTAMYNRGHAVAAARGAGRSSNMRSASTKSKAVPP